MNDPVIVQPNSGPWLTRNKRLLSGIAILGLLALLLLGHHETKPQPKQPEPAKRIEPADPQTNPPLQRIEPPSNQADQKHAAGAVPQKSKVQEKQEELRFNSLFAANVVSAPLPSFQPEEKGGPVKDQVTTPEPGRDAAAGTSIPSNSGASPDSKPRNLLDFDPTSPTYTLPEGTIIETVLSGKIDGEMAAPVHCMVTTPVYALNTRIVVIPAGAVFLGQASKVTAFGQQRQAVIFHRIMVPGPPLYSIPLDKPPPGLDQEGAGGLSGKVDNHYLQIFGASLLVGAIGGLAQVGNGYSGYGYDSSVAIRNGISSQMAMESQQILNRFLDRPPSIRTPVGTRVDIMLIQDLPAPAAPTGS